MNVATKINILTERIRSCCDTKIFLSQVVFLVIHITHALSYNLNRSSLRLKKIYAS